ncbi:MAG: YkgJ family cysteine cluster protein [Candidatus Methanomethylophilaceae archaeon]
MAVSSAEQRSERTFVVNIEIDYSEVIGKKAECPEKCGMCCLCQPEVLPEERYFFRTNFPKALVKSKTEDQHFAVAMKKGAGSCIFLNKRRCDIYQNRPTFCRQFPYHFYIGDRIRVEMDLSCRGVWSGKGNDAIDEAKILAERSEKRLISEYKEASSVYKEFYSICKEAGVFSDPSILRMSVSENLSKFVDFAFLAKIMESSLEEPRMALSNIIPDSNYEIKELEDAARDAAMGSLGSQDPLSVPVYCDEYWSWNMFMASENAIEWAVMDDNGDLHHKGFVDTAEIRLQEPDENGKKVLMDYISVLNGRDSFLGSVFYTMDQLEYEDDMANAYYGSLAVTVLDLLWRASLLNYFMGTGMGAEGIREAIIFYDMDRLDAPTIGAFV